MVGRGAVPVPLARRRVNGVTGPQLDDRAAAALDQPAALGHVQSLPIGVHAPRVAGARRGDAGRVSAAG